MNQVAYIFYCHCVNVFITSRLEFFHNYHQKIEENLGESHNKATPNIPSENHFIFYLFL
jgi:hypothetical protein